MGRAPCWRLGSSGLGSGFGDLSNGNQMLNMPAGGLGSEFSGKQSSIGWDSQALPEWISAAANSANTTPAETAATNAYAAAATKFRLTAATAPAPIL